MSLPDLRSLPGSLICHALACFRSALVMGATLTGRRADGAYFASTLSFTGEASYDEQQRVLLHVGYLTSTSTARYAIFIVYGGLTELYLCVLVVALHHVQSGSLLARAFRQVTPPALLCCEWLCSAPATEALPGTDCTRLDNFGTLVHSLLVGLKLLV